MNKKFFFIVMITFLSTGIFADDFGSAGALDKKNFDLEDMMRYAWEDEHMALAEYEAIMDKFKVDRPYANIARSEETHIALLTELYEAHDMPLPTVDVKDHIVLPSSLEEAAEIGVQAEIKNIEMYEIFLKKELPADVAEVFELLKDGSEKHLDAFERQLESPAGRGRRRS